MKIEIIQEKNLNNEIIEYVIIDHGNEQFTSMPKATYDEQQAALSTPMVTE